MKKETSKKMTIDDLAIMVAKGFDGVYKEIGEVKHEMRERFDDVDKRFDKVENDIAEVKENLASTRMDVLGIGDKFVSNHTFDKHLIRFSDLERKVKTAGKA